MPKYVVERDMQGVGALSPQEIQAACQSFCATVEEMERKVQWVQSYITDNRVYCVFIAPNEGLVREHARISGFPANRVSEVKTIVDPTTAGM